VTVRSAGPAPRPGTPRRARAPHAVARRWAGRHETNWPNMLRRTAHLAGYRRRCAHRRLVPAFARSRHRVAPLERLELDVLLHAGATSARVSFTVTRSPGPGGTPPAPRAPEDRSRPPAHKVAHEDLERLGQVHMMEPEAAQAALIRLGRSVVRGALLAIRRPRRPRDLLESRLRVGELFLSGWYSIGASDSFLISASVVGTRYSGSS